MQTYRRLLGIFYRNALMNELEYRLNFWSMLGMQLFWMVWSAVGAAIPFQFADSIAGWTYAEILVVLGMFHIMKGFQAILIEPNLAQMTSYVRMGTLDYILTKPINSQFMVSLRNLGVMSWSDPVCGTILLVYGLWLWGVVPSAVAIGGFVVLALAAMVVLYSLSLVIQSCTFWVVNMEGADMLVDSCIEAGRFPITFYSGWLRYVLTAIIPVALLTTFPAQQLLGRNPSWLVPLIVAVAVLAFVVASAFWRFALRSYASASS